MCGLDRVEILPLEVLDERELEALTLVEVADDSRDPVETGRDGGANPSLPGDQLIPIERLGRRGPAEARRVLGCSPSRSPSRHR